MNSPPSRGTLTPQSPDHPAGRARFGTGATAVGAPRVPDDRILNSSGPSYPCVPPPTGPPTFFQASKPPLMWQALARPASCAASTAMAERSPKAQ